jgi:hypothetical protein
LLGGSVTGHVHLDIPRLDFRADTKARGLDLRQTLAAEDNPNLPIIPLHWESRVDVDATTTWIADFKHMDSRGVMVWTPPSALAAGQIPATARFEYHYEMDLKQVQLAPGEIVTPSSLVVFRGALSMADSSLDATIDTEDLTVWDDFINRLRGSDVEPQRIGGRFHWQGRLTGPLTGPTVHGGAASDAFACSPGRPAPPRRSRRGDPGRASGGSAGRPCRTAPRSRGARAPGRRPRAGRRSRRPAVPVRRRRGRRRRGSPRAFPSTSRRS